MVFHVFYDDYIEPHVEVMVKETKFRFSLLDRKPLPGKAKATAKLRQQVQEWLKTEIPGGTRTVNDLVYDQWLKIRNGQPVQDVPTPDEIRVMARPKKKPKKSSRHGDYAIERIQVLPDFHLKVWFENGDVKLVDVPDKGKSFKVTQVKQKFGGLCLNFSGSDDAFDAIYVLVAAAEQESLHICEVCGQPGYLIGHNRTRCDVHFHSGSSPEWDERYQKTLTAAEWASAVTARRRLELMPTELVTHNCGHDRTYSRPSAEALKFVAEYAKTTLCWDCWKLARAKGER
jgi:hypothetical protein